MSELEGCWIRLQRGYKDTHPHTHMRVSSAAPSASSEQQVVLLTDLISPVRVWLPVRLHLSLRRWKQRKWWRPPAGSPQHIRWAEYTPTGLKRGAEGGQTGKCSRLGPQFNQNAVILTDSSEQNTLTLSNTRLTCLSSCSGESSSSRLPPWFSSFGWLDSQH